MANNMLAAVVPTFARESRKISRCSRARAWTSSPWFPPFASTLCRDCRVPQDLRWSTSAGICRRTATRRAQRKKVHRVHPALAPSVTVRPHARTQSRTRTYSFRMHELAFQGRHAQPPPTHPCISASLFGSWWERWGICMTYESHTARDASAFPLKPTKRRSQAVLAKKLVKIWRQKCFRKWKFEIWNLAIISCGFPPVSF